MNLRQINRIKLHALLFLCLTFIKGGNPVPVNVAVAKTRELKFFTRDVSQDNGCFPDEYYSPSFGCMTCTRCTRGFEHSPPEECGNGQGSEVSCVQCQLGFFQDKSDTRVLRCQPCRSCDNHADISSECTRIMDTRCGPCNPGWRYINTNECGPCSESDYLDPTILECQGPTSALPSLTSPQPPTTGPRPAEPTVSSNQSMKDEGTTPTLTIGQLNNRQNPVNAPQGLNIGLGVGIPCAVIFFGVLAVVLACRKSRNKGGPRNVSSGTSPSIAFQPCSQKEGLVNLDVIVPVKPVVASPSEPSDRSPGTGQPIQETTDDDTPGDAERGNVGVHGSLLPLPGAPPKPDANEGASQNTVLSIPGGLRSNADDNVPRGDAVDGEFPVVKDTVEEQTYEEKEEEKEANHSGNHGHVYYEIPGTPAKEHEEGRGGEPLSVVRPLMSNPPY